MRKALIFSTIVCLGFISLVGKGGETKSSYDEKLLRKAGQATDNQSLLNFLRRRTGSDSLQKQIQAAIKLLGHRRYIVREKASQNLIAIGRPAVKELRIAAKSDDLEVTDRAIKCLTKIELQSNPDIAGAAIRLLAKRKPNGTAKVLLDYLPAADNSKISEEIRSALPGLAFQGGQLNPVFAAALRDPSPEKRGAAAEALGIAGVKSQKDAVCKLLLDSEPTVRFRAALGMLAFKDRSAIPVLVSLLNELPLGEAWRAEEILYRLAGDKAPAIALGQTADSATKCRQAWEIWWRSTGKTIDLAKYNPSGGTLGYTGMIVFTGNGRGSVLEVDRAGNKRWEITGLNNPCDFRVVPGNRVLVAEYNSNRVTERTFDGKIVWSKTISRPIICQRLANGNTFIATQTALYEIDRQGKQISRINKSRIRAARRFRNKNIAVMLSNNQFELLSPTGNIIRTARVQLQIGNTLGGVDFHPNGNIVVTQTNKIAEYNAKGKIIWEAKVSNPYPLSYTPKGNILVASRNGSHFLELTKAGRQVWNFDVKGVPWIARRR